MASLAIGDLISPVKPAFAEEAGAPLFAYIGCFTTGGREAKGKGISLYRIDPDGAWTLLQTLETVPNPQFIAFDREQRFLYSVHGDGSEVCAYAIEKPLRRARDERLELVCAENTQWYPGTQAAVPTADKPDF
jgi:6-phosphogluconolactonase (cycloisomerase 2 family)